MTSATIAANNKSLDVITIGRASVDLYGQQIGGRLEDMGSFAKYVGGCPANIAVGTSRLGLKSALLTGVGEDHMGRFIIEQLEKEGVCIDGIKRDSERLTALVILGIRDQETFPLLFYRENCADMALCKADVNPEFIRSSRSVLITGTHLSTPTVREASMEAVRLAKESGGKVILDGDYRPVLWGLTTPELGEERFIANDEVTQQLQEVLPLCDLIVGTEEELHILAGTTDTLKAINIIRNLSSATIVCKRGEKGAVVFDGEIPADLDQGISHPGFPIEVFNVLGAGDAFMSGFLRGWLRDMPLEECCKLANASGALVVSRHGCAPAIPSWDEIQYFLKEGSSYSALRLDEKLNHVHHASNRDVEYNNVMIAAFDHRSQFEEIAASVGADNAKIPEFKQLILNAVNQVSNDQNGLGILADGRFGSRVLELAADHPYWIGRPIELPGSCPLEFESSADVATEINEWPLNHVVKCLCFYHPDDPESLKIQQEAQLLRLYDACRKTRHELLLEIICSKNGEVDQFTVSRAMQRFYDLGIYPDWWKLEPARDSETWKNIEDTINSNDPHCRGILLLGLSATEATLKEKFAIAADCNAVKGFAVGRTIFAEPAKQWFAGNIDDAEAVQQLKTNYLNLINIWQQVRPSIGNGVTG